MISLTEVPEYAQIKKVGASHLWRITQGAGTCLPLIWPEGRGARAGCGQLEVSVRVPTMMLHPVKPRKPRHQATDTSGSQGQGDVSVTHFEFTT